MNDSKNILIVSFTFPPYSGVGGRRWAKFAKFLTRAGHKVEVIAGVSGFKKQSPWVKDVEGIKVEYQNTGYPKYLGINPTTVFEKFMYRISLLYMKLTTKGNYFDKSAKWEKKLKKAISKRYNDLDFVFVTCAPFRMAYDLIPLVKRFNHIKWVVDFRDPWTNNKTAYGFEGLYKERKAFELNAEKQVINTYDEIISVAEPMTKYFKKLSPNKAISKFKTIPNGFDPDDFSDVENHKKKDDLFFSFVFAGTLYNKAYPAFELLCEKIEELKVEDGELYKKLKFTFIGTEKNKVDLLGHPNTKILPFLPLNVVKRYLYEANAGLLFLTPDIDWSFSTKFTDYVGAQLPILVVSEKESFTGNYCIKKGIGEALFISKKIQFKEILNRLQNHNLIKDDIKDYFNLNKLVETLLVE